MLLLSCTSKKDSNIQATIDSLFIYDNHPTLEISEAKYLQWVDSVLGVKGVKLIDYRNGIYQYDDTRFYWNRTFDYFLVYPSSFTHGEALHEWFDIMIDTEIEQGNRIVKKDITDHSYTIEGNTKGGRCFYSKATHKKAYEREIIVTVKLKYTDSRRKEVEKLLPNIFKYVSTNEL